MTAANVAYYPWNSRTDPKSKPWDHCQPNVVAWQKYIEKTWGGQYLGCHNDRFIAGTTKWSDHAWGTALDWLFPNRSATARAIDFFIFWGRELGLNTIHDYELQRMWKPFTGWRTTHAIGSPWGKWLHFETNLPMVFNGSSVESRLAAPAPPPPPIYAPEFGLYLLYPWNRAKETIGPFSGGEGSPLKDLVKYAQGAAYHQFGQRQHWIWGLYDGATVAAVHNIQAVAILKYPTDNQLKQEGWMQVVGPATWRAIDARVQGVWK